MVLAKQTQECANKGPSGTQQFMQGSTWSLMKVTQLTFKLILKDLLALPSKGAYLGVSLQSIRNFPTSLRRDTS